MGEDIHGQTIKVLEEAKNYILLQESEIEKLKSKIEKAKKALGHISTLNKVGPYEAIKGPRIAQQALEELE